MTLKTIILILKNGIQNSRNNDYDILGEFSSHIQTLQSEVHFLREEQGIVTKKTSEIFQ